MIAKGDGRADRRPTVADTPAKTGAGECDLNGASRATSVD
jgi:hypothetical protein